MLDITAREAVFEVRTDGPPVVVLNALPVEQDGPVTRVRLGDLAADQEVTLLLAVPCPATPEGEAFAVDCRVGDRDGALVSTPLAVSWAAVPAEADARQPVNREVLVAVAEMLADRARQRALQANKAHDFTAADQTLDAGVDRIRQLGLDDERVAAIVRQLLDEKAVFAAEMEPMARKALHFASYSLAYSRAEGKARRR